MPKIFSILFFILFFALLSCSNKILKPLKGGIPYVSQPKGAKDRFKYRPFEMGTTVYLSPRKNLNVRAIENCKILVVFSDGDSSKIIVAKGEMEVGYGNLKKSFVAVGDSISKGQIIGQLYTPDSSNDNSLSVYIRKGDMRLRPKW